MIGGRWAFIAVSLLIAIAVGVRFGHMLAQSDAALQGIIDVFSILAGVLVAVMSIIGDPSMLLTGNWRLGQEHATEIQKKIARYAHLIFVYVLILIVVLIATIIKDNKIADAEWFFQAVFAISTFGLLLSLPLPYTLMAIQKERMTEEIRRRKNQPSQ